jgi:DNA-binding response OmpR family regulator
VAHDRLVLLIEDDDAFRYAVQTTFERRGFRVDAVSSGAEALDRLAAATYDAVVLDLMLPGLSGWSVLTYLESESPKQLTRTVIMTGMPPAAIRNAAPSFTGRVFHKPFDVDGLVDHIESLL